MSQFDESASSAQEASEPMAEDSLEKEEYQDTSLAAGLPWKVISTLQQEFEAEPKNKLAQNMVTSDRLLSVCLDRKVISQVNHVFQHKIPTEGKPVAHQPKTNTCWIYAYLNAMRIPFMEKFELKNFEFSQNHIFFWYMIERAYSMLNAFEEAAKRKEPVDGRLFQFLLTSPNPMHEGGQWGMVTNIINKYGVMPKTYFPEANDARDMIKFLSSKLRSFAVQLCSMVEGSASQDELDKEKLKMMAEVHKVTKICLGSPPKTFTWEYYDESKNYKKVGPITPREFYHEHVKPLYNVDDKVYLSNDCRPGATFGKLYTVEFTGNIVGGRLDFNNQPIDVLKKAAAESIKAGEPVFCGCDAGEFSDYKLAIFDLEVYDFESVLGVSKKKNIDKAQTQMFSCTKHAWLFTAFSEADGDENKYVKWRVENSWGEASGDKGYGIVTDDWFTQYVFAVAVDKMFVPDDVMAVLKQEPVVLPAWDQMGRLW